MSFLESHSFEIDEDDLKLKRLDKILKKRLPKFSRTYLKKLFLENYIEGSVELQLKKVPPLGTQVDVTIPFPEDYDITPQNIPLNILFEDEYLIILNKQENLVIHPAPGNWEGTLVNALLYHCKDLKGIGNQKRPGIVHRLDKGTTGVMVVAKEQTTHERLSEMFRKHDLKREYLALTFKCPTPPAGTIKSFIARSPQNRLKMTSEVSHGKTAMTHYEVLESFQYFSYVKLTLETGRTHQIRVHLSEKKKTPIINDFTYGNPRQQTQNYPQLKQTLKDYEHPLLHAHLLEFKHPITNELLSFQTKPNSFFLNTLDVIRSM